MAEITASLFGDMLPDSLKQQTTQGYTPEYFNQVQNYYQGYLPTQSLDTQALQDWYGNSSQVNYGGNTYAQPAQSPATTQPPPSAPIGGDTGSSGYDSSTGLNPQEYDLFGNIQNLNNPLVQALLSLAPYGLGGALGGYQSALNANQLNDVVGLYGGTLGDEVNPFTSALQGLFGASPDTVQASQSLANQFGTTGQFAGYMQAGTDPVLGGIVNSLAGLAPEGLTAQQYGTIAQSVGQQINETIASNPGLSYAEAAAITASNLGVNTSAPPDTGTSTGTQPSDNSQSYGGGDSTSSSSADSTASDNSGVGGW